MSASPEPEEPRGLRALFRTWRARGSADHTLRQSIEEAMDEHADDGSPAGDLSAVERLMLRNLLEYGEMRVDDVAVPRADIIAFDAAQGFDDLVRLFAEAGHSRLPVYRDNLDAIVGMVHVKDVYAHLANPGASPRIEQLLRSVLFAPPSMRLLDLLARMRANRIHMAIVVDEYGGADGLVTIEDLVEQIVGDIRDEHDDAAEKMLRPLGAGVWDADARLPLEELEETLNVDFLPEDDDEDVDTLGGVVYSLAGRLPAIGEVIDHPLGYRFEILDAEARRLKRVRITALPKPLAAPDDAA